jgi:hypothetical protein
VIHGIPTRNLHFREHFWEFLSITNTPRATSKLPCAWGWAWDLWGLPKASAVTDLNLT